MSPACCDNDKRLIPELTIAEVERGLRQRHDHRRHDPQGRELRRCGATRRRRARSSSMAACRMPVCWSCSPRPVLAPPSGLAVVRGTLATREHLRSRGGDASELSARHDAGTEGSARRRPRRCRARSDRPGWRCRTARRPHAGRIRVGPRLRQLRRVHRGRGLHLGPPPKGGSGQALVQVGPVRRLLRSRGDAGADGRGNARRTRRAVPPDPPAWHRWRRWLTAAVHDARRARRAKPPWLTPRRTTR